MTSGTSAGLVGTIEWAAYLSLLVAPATTILAGICRRQATRVAAIAATALLMCLNFLGALQRVFEVMATGSFRLGEIGYLIDPLLVAAVILASMAMLFSLPVLRRR